jgi:hypothetical protein
MLQNSGCAARRRSSVAGAYPRDAWAARKRARACDVAWSAGGSTDSHQAAKIRQSDSKASQVLPARLPRVYE